MDGGVKVYKIHVKCYEIIASDYFKMAVILGVDPVITRISSITLLIITVSRYS